MISSPRSVRHAFMLLAALSALSAVACFKSSGAGSDKEWTCSIAAGGDTTYAGSIGCKADFTMLASTPISATIPGARSGKTVVDLQDNGKLYFQNSKLYQIHWEFASSHLSGNGKPVVASLSQFNQVEYYSPDRRFILGAITYYEGPKVWAWEISPYDNASAEMITYAFDKIRASVYFGDSLYFHPTSKNVEVEAAKLPSRIKVITTDQIFAGIDYQPLNEATSMGRLVFMTSEQLEDSYVGFRDIVVLDAVPNDISATSGIITQEFQTPLSHINVLSRNRGTPNMGLKGAMINDNLRALEGKWVKLIVGASSWSIEEVTQTEADAWWDAHRPPAVGVAKMDTSVKDLRSVEDILDTTGGVSWGDAIKKAIPAFGGKGSHFAAFPHMDTTKVKTNKAFVVPVYYYWQHMQKNGFNDTVTKWLADPAFTGNPAERDKRLKRLRAAIKAAPLDSGFIALLNAKLDSKFPGVDRVRFRSSTNAEDLDGFTGAGLYESHAGSRTDASDHIYDAIRNVWASVWLYRTFEERTYRSIDHMSVGMAMLVHRSHPEEEGGGVAITNNPFDQAGLDPAFYVNAQKGGESVVLPPAGTTTDQFLYYFDSPAQPIVFMFHSSLVASGSTVLTPAQTYALGTALKEIHRFFKSTYGKDPSKWYAMDTEFKLDQPENDPTGTPIIIMKQARPYPAEDK
ncbi:MAG TPA: PEP/pyruvate-binding domain-containing protein [Fibrobacteria bacterium]|nr:PEP/pyruvate-binding domain-containing protein [Fibrobacteria bacterium]